MKRGSGCCANGFYCTAALTSLSDSISYMTILFSEWCITDIYCNCIFTLIDYDTFNRNTMSNIMEMALTEIFCSYYILYE